MRTTPCQRRRPARVRTTRLRGSRVDARERARLADPARAAGHRADAFDAATVPAIARGLPGRALGARCALDATPDRGIAERASRMARAVRVVPALDAEPTVLVARETARAVLVTFFAGVDAAMRARIAPLARAAGVVRQALHAIGLRSAEATRRFFAIVVAQARHTRAGRSVATRAATLRVARARPAGCVLRGRAVGRVALTDVRNVARVDRMSVELERAVAGRIGDCSDGSERSDEERGDAPTQGSAATSASASARAKPAGRCLRYSFAAWIARARFDEARMRMRSTSAFSASGPAG